MHTVLVRPSDCPQSNALWADSVLLKVGAVVSGMLRAAFPCLQSGSHATGARILQRGADAAQRDARANVRGNWDNNTMELGVRSWIGGELEHVTTWLTEFAPPPVCASGHRMTWHSNEHVPTGTSCVQCRLPTPTAHWRCACAAYICSRCTPHSSRVSLEATIEGLDQPHLDRVRAFLIGSGAVQWLHDFDPSQPLDNPNPVSHHWFCAIREESGWFWWDTLRRHRRIPNLARFLVRATQNGRLYVFRDAAVSAQNGSPSVSVSYEDQHASTTPSPPDIFGDDCSATIGSPPSSPASQPTIFIQNSQGQRYCRRDGDALVCLVCGKRLQTKMAMISHVFRHSCRDRLDSVQRPVPGE